MLPEINLSTPQEPSLPKIGGRVSGGLLRALRGLDLTIEQREQVQELIRQVKIPGSRNDTNLRQKLRLDVEALLTPTQREQMRLQIALQDTDADAEEGGGWLWPTAGISAREQQFYEEAATYSAFHGGFAVLIIQGGNLVFEQYDHDHTAQMACVLASATKSFWGAAAAAAVDDGFLQLDELACETLHEWDKDPWKSQITIRHLLNFTSGLNPADQELDGIGVVNKYQYILNVEAEQAPGTVFRYGPSHLCAFGEILRRKRAWRREDPLDYLQRRIFRPIGLEVFDWRRDQADNPLLPAGASMTAREWAKFGELLRAGGLWQGERVINAATLAECFMGSTVNPAYGLGFWLNQPTDAAGLEGLESVSNWLRRRTSKVMIHESDCTDLAMAAGAGKQRLYIIPSREIVVVRQGDKGGKFRDEEFLTLLLGE